MADARSHARGWVPPLDELERLLLDGDAAAAHALIRQALAAGATAPAVYLQLFHPVLCRIGDAWEHGEINVAIEHRATHIVTQTMARLSEHFRRPGPPVGVAVAVTLPHEQHGVAIAMAADFLRSAGWEVHLLGTDVPFADLGKFLELVRADLVCVSVPVAVADATYEQLRAAVGDQRLIMGGAGLDPALAARIGAEPVNELASLPDVAAATRNGAR